MLDDQFVVQPPGLPKVIGLSPQLGQSLAGTGFAVSVGRVAGGDRLFDQVERGVVYTSCDVIGKQGVDAIRMNDLLGSEAGERAVQ